MQESQQNQESQRFVLQMVYGNKSQLKMLQLMKVFKQTHNEFIHFITNEGNTYFNLKFSQTLPHFALAKLEKEYQGKVLVVTQNIDNLHERAGSEHLIHMHGELLKSRCEHCLTVTDCRSDLAPETRCSSCQATALRPHVVWFGEEPLQIEEIYQFFLKSSIFISIGTSGQVYPAAGFAHLAMKNKFSKIIEVNLVPSTIKSKFSDHRYGKATELVPQLVDEILGAP